jgi:hypothetical protein
LPENSAAGFAAAAEAWLARLRAVCWRPRARPPADAARLRAVLPPERLVEERREVELLREELLRDELDDDRRVVPPRLDPDVEDRLLEPLLDERPRREDPPLLPPDDSAISSPPR